MNKILMLSFVMTFLFSLSLVSAGLFDSKGILEVELDEDIIIGEEIIEYNPIWETYAPVEVRGWDWFGLVEDSLKWRSAIDNHTFFCGIDCLSELTTYVDGYTPLIDENGLKFYTILDDGTRIEEPIRSYQVLVFINNEWVNYNLGEILPEGTYTWQLIGQKRPDKTIDWVVEVEGEEINEWSIWGTNTGSLRNGLVAYYPFEETSGTTVTDIINSSNGQRTGVTPNVEGKINKAYSFNGTASNYANTSKNLKNYGITDNFTIAFWFRVNATGNMMLLEDGNDFSNSSFYVYTSGNNNIGYSVRNGSTQFYDDSNPVSNFDGRWGLVVFTYNGSIANLYYNNSLISSNAITGNIFNGSVPIQIGRRYSGSLYLNGSIDELSIWNRVLNTSEMDALYNNGSGVAVYPSYIIINSPDNNSIQYSNLVTINASIFTVGGATPVNISLYDNSTGTYSLRSLMNITYFPSSLNWTNDTDYSSGSVSYNIAQSKIVNNFVENMSSYIKGNTDVYAKFQILYVNGSQINSSEFIYPSSSDYIQINFSNPNVFSNVSTIRLWERSGTTAILHYADNLFIQGFNSTSTNTSQIILNYSGSTLFGFKACDSDGACGFSENRTFSIDTTAPTITSIYPTGNIGYLFSGRNVSLNYSINDTNLNSCWFEYNNTNTTIPCVAQTEYNNVSMPNTFADSNYFGARILAKNNFELSSVTTTPTSTGTNLRLMHDNGTIIQTATNSTPNVFIISSQLVAGNYYRIEVDGGIQSWSNTTWGYPKEGNNIYWVNGSNNGANVTPLYNIIGISATGNTTYSFIQGNSSQLFGKIWANDTIGNKGYSDLNWSYTIFENSQTYNTSTYETATETFTINQTGATSVDFWFNGTKYSETISNGFSSKTLDMPTTSANYTFFWSFDNGLYNTTATNISVNALNFTICGSAPQNNTYLNITFRNETLGNQSITAQIQASFNYWLGSGSYFKSYTFTNTSENVKYTFCANNANLTIKGNETITYSNTVSPQRNYVNSDITLNGSNPTTQILYLLPSSDGYYVTFQVVTSSRQVISGATVTLSRSGYGIVESRTTDDSGVATFFMNPNIAYTVVASYSGYDEVSSTITPTQTTYTITLGSSSEVGVTDYSRGVSIQILPRSRTLTQNLNYNFNITFTSDYYALTQYGMLISNENGVLYANVTGNNAGGGVVNALLNVGTNKSFYVKGFYVVNGSINYIGSTGFAIWTNDTGYSVGAFFNRLNGYLDNQNDTNGLYGLTKNSSNGGYSLSLSILIFVLIFMTMGIIGYQYGINQQFLILGIATFISYLLEVAYPIIDIVRDQAGSTITNFPFLTFFLALATVGIGIWEGSH